MKVIGLSYLFVAVGGALGAMARYALNVLMQRDLAFPWGTLSANLLGCLAMGVVAQLVASAAWFNEAGFCSRPVPTAVCHWLLRQFHDPVGAGHGAAHDAAPQRDPEFVQLPDGNDAGWLRLFLPGIRHHAPAAPVRDGTAGLRQV